MRTSHLIETRPEWVEPIRIPPESAWRELDPNPLVAAILYRRGLQTVDDAHVFMHPGEQPPLDSYRIPNMDRAVERILRSIAEGETVGIFGDYDVDGITSTAILTQALRHTLGEPRVIPRLPDRAEGYGLNRAAIAEFKKAGVSLVIAVDCGSTDHTHAACIAGEDMDLVILDHHRMLDSGPDGAITVSPQLDSDDTHHDLTAVGVAYLLICALAGRGVAVGATATDDPATYLDLVALGTVADVAPLDSINRRLVFEGIEAIRSGSRIGVSALIESAQLDLTAVTATDISFSLAPRINSAGRIGSPQLAFDLMMTGDPGQAKHLAADLEHINFRRKTRSAQVLAEAYDKITQQPNWRHLPVFVTHHPGWEPGLVGAVASRMVEEVRRPVFLFREEAGVLYGSARSVDGFNLIDSLHGIASKLTRFGGHSLAAGLTLAAEQLPDLESHVVEMIRRSGLPIPAPRKLLIDANLPPEYLTIGTVRELRRMEPFGRGNDQPLLRIANAKLLRYTAIGHDRSHLKIFAKAGGRHVEAVFWGGAWRSRELVGQRSIDLVGRLEINMWNGQERLQLVLDNFRAA
jgi:single-stranded-DNA-specific exonuclease